MGDMSGVPTIPMMQQAARTHASYEAYVSSTVRCFCHPDNNPMLLRGQDLLIECPRCKATFEIHAIRFDNKTRELAVAVLRREPSLIQMPTGVKV